MKLPPFISNETIFLGEIPSLERSGLLIAQCIAGDFVKLEISPSGASMTTMGGIDIFDFHALENIRLNIIATLIGAFRAGMKHISLLDVLSYDGKEIKLPWLNRMEYVKRVLHDVSCKDALSIPDMHRRGIYGLAKQAMSDGDRVLIRRIDRSEAKLVGHEHA